MADGRSGKTIAYMMSRFPKLSETFILYEILELERLGLRIEIFPLQREHEDVMHPEAAELVARAHFSPFVSPGVITAQIYWLRARPRAYLSAWVAAIRGNARSRKFLTRALAVVPQAAFFARQMQRLGIEHIHAHWATHPALSAFVISRLTGIPYSVTAHASDIYVDRAMLGEKLACARFAVTISEHNRDILQRWYPAARGKIVVVHCGVDPSVFTPRQDVGKRDRFTILCIARLVPFKGHPHLIDACARLKDQGLDFRCLLVGDGPERHHIQQHIRRAGLSGHVELMGAQPRGVVRALMAEAHVVALTSCTTAGGRKEGIPVSLMEAMASGLPVVATDYSGLSELVEHGRTGLLAPEGDVATIADAIRRLHDDPQFAMELGRSGRRKVVEAFNLRRNAELLAGLFVAGVPSTSGALRDRDGVMPPLVGQPVDMLAAGADCGAEPAPRAPIPSIRAHESAP